jgi:hypothetical protein
MQGMMRHSGRDFAVREGCRQFKADDGLLAHFKLTASALLDAPFSDGGRAGTKPSGFELLRLRPRPSRKASPARREGSRATVPARLFLTSVRIRELSYSSSFDPRCAKGLHPRSNHTHLRELANSVCGGSFDPGYARVSKKAPVRWAVHQSAALLTGHATSGHFGHGDSVSGPATAFMRSCEPFHKFGHARNTRCVWSNVAIFRVYCQSST